MARVLCIDDELGLRRLLRRVLEPEGHVVFTAGDGVTGLQMACAEEWDLVILDLLLPDLPGTAVLSALLENKPDQRVVVLSALGDTESRVTCLERGAVDYVSKPFAIREFKARVRSRLAEQPRIAGAASSRPPASSSTSCDADSPGAGEPRSSAPASSFSCST